MPECENCGSFVTPGFARVFGDNRNEVHGCKDCLMMAERRDGARLSSGPHSYSLYVRSNTTEADSSGRIAFDTAGKREVSEMTWFESPMSYQYS